MSRVSNKPPRKLIYGNALLLFVLTILLRYWHQSRSIWSDWMLVFPLWQLVFTCFVSIRYRNSPAAHVHNSIATLAIGAMWLTTFLGVFDLWLFYFVDGIIHIGMPLGWAFALAGVFAVPICLRRRWFLPLKIWLLTIATLVTAESAAQLLESPDEPVLNFPHRLLPPPDNEIHVAAIGGSSTLGYPYQPKFGFPQVILWELEQAYPNRSVVLHNLAQGGLNLEQAISKLKLLKNRPHLLLVYSGHNEFYHHMQEFERREQSPIDVFDTWMGWSASFRISNRFVSRLRSIRESRGGRRLLIDKPIATPPLYARRLNRFRNQCDQLNSFCLKHDITPVWFVPAASESGFEPNRSGDRIRMSTAKQAAIHETTELVKSLDNESKIEAYRRCLEHTPDFAEFHFRLAECLQAAGDATSAREHYLQAIDLDGHPLRANFDYRDAVRQSAQMSNVPVVETPEFLRTHSADRILGKELFLDNVHMTLKGYYLTGLAGFDEIIESKSLEQEFGPPHRVESLTLFDAIDRANLNRQDLVKAYRKTAAGLLELAEWRFDRTDRQRECERFKTLEQSLEDFQIDPGQSGAESLQLHK